jgi:hypothetical protein
MTIDRALESLSMDEGPEASAPELTTRYGRRESTVERAKLVELVAAP